MECPFTSEEFINTSRDQLYEQAFQAAMHAFTRKTERLQSVAWPVIKQVFENQGEMYERILVPITDGKRVYNIPCNLREAYDTEAKSVVKQFEKTIMLHIIDDCWKENLRQLDELRHSVQNASYRDGTAGGARGRSRAAFATLQRAAWQRTRRPEPGGRRSHRHPWWSPAATASPAHREGQDARPQ